MTRARVTAQQLTRPPKSARLMRGTVSAVLPLTVQIAGGGAVGGIPIPGAVYTVGAAVLVLVQEPGVGPVYPIPGTASLPASLLPPIPASLLPPIPASLLPPIPASLLPPIPTASFGSLPIITSLDTAPDGMTFLGSGQTPFGDGALLVETFTASVNGTPWRLQAVTSEQNGGRRSRSSWAGAWGAWSGGTASVTNASGRTDWGTGQNRITRQGQLVALQYQVNLGSPAPALGSTVGTIPAGFRPAAPIYLSAMLWPGSFSNQRAEIEIRADGSIVLQSATGTLTSAGLFVNVTYTAA